MLTLKVVLKCFKPASSLKDNFFKSKLAEVAVASDLQQRLAAILNFWVMVIPFIYLGIPVGANHRRVNMST